MQAIRDLSILISSSGSLRSDDYIRDTVILDSVLSLIGISTQFPVRRGRYGLITVGVLLLLVAGEQLLTLPGPP